MADDPGLCLPECHGRDLGPWEHAPDCPNNPERKRVGWVDGDEDLHPERDKAPTKAERREREGLHIGTMTQTEQDIAMIRTTLNNFGHKGHTLGDSLGALARLETQLAEAERENGLHATLETFAERWESCVDENLAIQVAVRQCGHELRHILDRAALNPPDPPASPAEGSEAATEVAGTG